MSESAKIGFFIKILIWSHLSDGAKNDPKEGLSFWQKLSYDSSENSGEWKITFFFCFLVQTLYLGKFLFLSYFPKYSCPVRLQDSFKCNMARKNWVIILIFCIRNQQPETNGPNLAWKNKKYHRISYQYNKIMKYSKHFYIC